MSLLFVSAVPLVLLFAAFSSTAHAAVQSNQVHRQLRHQLASGAAAHKRISKTSRNVEVSDGPSKLEDNDEDDDDADGADSDPEDNQAELAEERQEAIQFVAQQKRKKDDKDAEVAKLELQVTNAREALADTMLKLSDFRVTKARLENKNASDQEIDATVRVVANETESKGMATMLGDMWKEMRMYEAPGYTLYLATEIQKLEKQKTQQEQELSNAQAALAAKLNEAPSTTAAPPTTTLTVALKETKPWQPWWMERKVQALASGLVYITFGILAAMFYARYRANKTFLAVQIEPKTRDWSTPILGCTRNHYMCLVGCCCPCLRWADTIDKAKLGMTYWPAFMLMLLLMTLNMYFYGITALVMYFVGVRFRQIMRAKYGLPYGSRQTYLEDCLVWICCTPCAIIQEAHEEAAHR